MHLPGKIRLPGDGLDPFESRRLKPQVQINCIVKSSLGMGKMNMQFDSSKGYSHDSVRSHAPQAIFVIAGARSIRSKFRFVANSFRKRLNPVTLVMLGIPYSGARIDS